MAGKFMDVSVFGYDQLQRRMQRLDLLMDRQVFKQASLDAAVPVLNRARELVPVLTGKLRDSLRIRYTRGRSGRHGVRVETGKRRSLGIPEDATHFYPAVIEYKHRSYLRRAVHEKRSEAIAIMRKVIKRGINAV